MSNQKTSEYATKFAISVVAATILFYVNITGIRLTEGHQGLIIVLGFLSGWFIFQAIKNCFLFMRSL